MEKRSGSGEPMWWWEQEDLIFPGIPAKGGEGGDGGSDGYENGYVDGYEGRVRGTTIEDTKLASGFMLQMDFSFLNVENICGFT